MKNMDFFPVKSSVLRSGGLTHHAASDESEMVDGSRWVSVTKQNHVQKKPGSI